MRILYLFQRQLYETKMSSGRRWYGEAVGAEPWGEGWPGYLHMEPLSANVERLTDRPDWLWVYQTERLIDPGACSVPKVIAFNEAWWPEGRAIREAEACGAAVVIHHHANDAEQFAGFRGRLVHIPHGAPDLFSCARPLAERTTDCLSHGVHSPGIYPVRARLARLVSHGRLPGRILRHPGYRLASTAACDAQAARYAADLGDAKVSLCCTSKHRYLLAKIVESMRAGCVVVTDRPNDPVYDEFIRPHVLEIDPARHDDQIVEFINRAMADPERLQAMADSGRAVADRHFTTRRYAERFIEGLK